MKQSSLIRREKWDVLVVLSVCSYEGFAERIEQAGLCGELVAADCRWPQLEIWFERNFWQFATAYRNTTFVSASPFPWKPQCKTFLNVWREAIPQWELRGGEKAKSAIKKARSVQKPDTKLVVFLVGNPDEALVAIKEHLDEFEGQVMVTAAHGGGSTIVPWLRVAPCPKETVKTVETVEIVVEPTPEPEPGPEPEPILEEPEIEPEPELELEEPVQDEEPEGVLTETEDDLFPTEEWTWLVDET